MSFRSGYSNCGANPSVQTCFGFLRLIRKTDSAKTAHRPEVRGVFQLSDLFWRTNTHSSTEAIITMLLFFIICKNLKHLSKNCYCLSPLASLKQRECLSERLFTVCPCVCLCMCVCYRCCLWKRLVYCPWVSEGAKVGKNLHNITIC